MLNNHHGPNDEPDTMSELRIISHPILATGPGGRDYLSHVRAKETGSGGWRPCQRVTQLGRMKCGFLLSGTPLFLGWSCLGSFESWLQELVAFTSRMRWLQWLIPCQKEKQVSNQEFSTGSGRQKSPPGQGSWLAACSDSSSPAETSPMVRETLNKG